MPSEVLPNDAISNLCFLMMIPTVSSFVIRFKHRLCDTYSRRPRQLTTDQHLVVISNLLSFSVLVVYAAAVPGNSRFNLERMVVLDLLLGMHMQRWLENKIHANDTAPYYEPGPLSLAQRKRRVKMSLMLTTLTCSYCAATSVVLGDSYGFYQNAHYTSSSQEYWFLVAGLPAIHSALRTLALDTQGCRRRRCIDMDQNLDLPTNQFTITDEEDESYEHGSPREDHADTAAL